MPLNDLRLDAAKLYKNFKLAISGSANLLPSIKLNYLANDVNVYNNVYPLIINLGYFSPYNHYVYHTFFHLNSNFCIYKIQ